MSHNMSIMDINDIFKFGLSLSSGNNDNGGYYFRDAISVQGAAYAPDALIDASMNISGYDLVSQISIDGKVATAEVDYDLQENSIQLGGDAKKVVAHIEDGSTLSGEYFARKVNRINLGFRDMHRSVGKRVFRFADKGKIVGVIGGDHSVTLGAVRSISALY